MKINKWLIAVLVFMGISVGAISLYTASFSGVMAKMGLVGGDFGQSVQVNKLARQLKSLDGEIDCGIWNVSKKVPVYLFSKGNDRVKLSGELGGERIMCGVKLVQSSNIERGVYTIIKGLYYLRTHYTEMRVLVQADNSQCGLLTSPKYERWVEAYLLSTESRVHDVVFEIYKQVEQSRAHVEELCFD